jgi:hypothetical protein
LLDQLISDKLIENKKFRFNETIGMATNQKHDSLHEMVEVEKKTSYSDNEKSIITNNDLDKNESIENLFKIPVDPLANEVVDEIKNTLELESIPSVETTPSTISDILNY